MAEELYELYARLFDQQVDLAEEAVIGVVRTAFGDFSRDFKRHLRSLVPLRRPPATSGSFSRQQQLNRAQGEIEAARDTAQRQIATALANGFGALADLPSALVFSANQQSVLSISGTSTQATVGAIAGNNNDDNSEDDSMSIKSEDTSECESDCESHSDDETEIKEETMEEDTMAAIAATSNVNPNSNDTVSVKTEIESECDSSDSDSSDEEEELTAGREIKEEIEDVHLNDHVMGNSVDETGAMQMMEEDEEERSTESTNPSNSNFENADSNEAGNEHLSEAMMIEASNEQDQAGPSNVSNSTSTLTRRSTRASAARTVKYSEAMENSEIVTDQQHATLTGTRKRKRSNGRSGKSADHKRTRARVVPAPPVAVEEAESEKDESPEPEAISLSVIVRRLKCRVPGCKKVFPGKVQLDGHLLVKHAIEKYACKVKDCTESYATKAELEAHRNSAHDNLDNEWPCGQCTVTCNTYNELSIHTYQYHEFGLFACSADKCDYTEKTRIKVKNHQANHRPAKYRCTFAGCSSSFKQKSNLTAHLRTHSKEKPFLCSQCPLAFALKHHLTDHELTHSGLKPYSCTWPHCDYTASQQNNVIRHVRGVHFGMPRTKTEQAKRGIIDDRDAKLFVKKTATGN